MKEWGWTNPVLADEAGGVIAGHARILAARQLGYGEVPVMVARGWSDAQKRAYVIADNQLALNAGWDRELLGLELGELKLGGFDLALTGFGELELGDLLADRTQGLTDPRRCAGGSRASGVAEGRSVAPRAASSPLDGQRSTGRY